MTDHLQPLTIKEWHITAAIQRYWNVYADMFEHLQFKHATDVAASTKFLGERVFAQQRSASLRRQLDMGPADAEH